MKTEEAKHTDLKNLSTEQLHILFQKTNSALVKNMINGAALHEEQYRIQLLNKISKTLLIRNGISDDN